MDVSIIGPLAPHEGKSRNPLPLVYGKSEGFWQSFPSQESLQQDLVALITVVKRAGAVPGSRQPSFNRSRHALRTLWPTFCIIWPTGLNGTMMMRPWTSPKWQRNATSTSSHRYWTNTIRYQSWASSCQFKWHLTRLTFTRAKLRGFAVFYKIIRRYHPQRQNLHYELTSISWRKEVGLLLSDGHLTFQHEYN